MIGHVAVGSWSGGRFMRFGEPIADARLEALLRPGNGIRSVMTADAYGAGEADALVGRALKGVPRTDYALTGAIGHDFYKGEREGAKGYPRFTDPRLRPPQKYGDYLRMATERSLQRCGVDSFDLLLLHNPDRRGFESPEVWSGLRELRDAGLARALGVAPGPANGFTLDLIGCFERYGELIDWAMIILNPLEPWPGEMVFDAAARFDVSIVTRVVDYGGLFHDDLLPGHSLQTRRPPPLPPRWLGRGRAREARAAAPDRGTARTDDAPVGMRLEPLPRGGRLRRAHADRGARRGQADRAQARGAGGRARALAADGRRGGGDPGDRRQHRVDAAEGRHARPRRRGPAGPLGARRRSSSSWPGAGASTRSATCAGPSASPDQGPSSSSAQRWSSSVSSGRAWSRHSA